MCHTITPRPECGAYLLREPKGDPDVIIVNRSGDSTALFQAAAILGVQGYTARLVFLCDEALFLRQEKAYRESILPAGRASTTIFEEATPQKTAEEARKAILSSIKEQSI